MFYEEKIIDGMLFFRNTPDGKWLPKITAAHRLIFLTTFRSLMEDGVFTVDDTVKEAIIKLTKEWG